MDEIYKMLFNDVLPRVLEDMRIMLQSSSEDITGGPYRLPTFLTPRIFALEFMRQRLYAEEEHFRAFKKYSNVKFPFKVGPFIFKNKSALLVIEKLFVSYGFSKRGKSEL